MYKPIVRMHIGVRLHVTNPDSPALTGLIWRLGDLAMWLDVWTYFLARLVAGVQASVMCCMCCQVTPV